MIVHYSGHNCTRHKSVGRTLIDWSRWYHRGFLDYENVSFLLYSFNHLDHHQQMFQNTFQIIFKEAFLKVWNFGRLDRCLTNCRSFCAFSKTTALNFDNLAGFWSFHIRHTSFKKFLCFYFMSNWRNEYFMFYKKFRKYPHVSKSYFELRVWSIS